MPHSLADITELVKANNRSKHVSDRFVICLIWKESGFRPRRNEEGSSAAGLMQLTKAAITDVNRSTAHDETFTQADMSDLAKNIRCGTRYLDLRINRLGGDVAAGVDGFGTGQGYSKTLFTCEACMKTTPSNIACLLAIHS